MSGFTHLIVMFLVAAVASLRERFSSVESIRRRQLRLLANLVSRARAAVPFYTNLYKGIDEKNFRLEDLPPVTKRDLIDNLSDTLSERGITKEEIISYSQDSSKIGTLFRGRYVLCATSGTTGRVGYFLNTVREWSVLRGVEFARLLRGRLSPPFLYKYLVRQRFRWAMIVATGGHYITYLLMKMSPRTTKLLADVRPFSIMEPVPKMVEELNEFKPQYLHGYPTFLEALAYEKLAGRLKISPDFISVGSEPFTRTARSVLHQAFPGAVLSETYGTTEVLSIANQCKNGRLHIHEDYTILEAVDENDHPVPEGTRSRRTLVTNLVNHTQPLIRYELSDSIVIHPAGCPCGSPFKSVEVHGRSDDTFFLRDDQGRYHAFPPIPFEVLFLGIKGLRQYQLVHEEQNHLLVRFSLSGTRPEEEVASEIRWCFKEYLEASGIWDVLKLDIEETGELTRPPTSQKVRQIFSRVKPPEEKV